MSRQQLPSIDAKSVKKPQAEQAEPIKKASDPVAEVVTAVSNRIIEIGVPFRQEASIGYTRRRLDVMLTQSQAETAKCIAEALDRASIKLNNGKQVESPTDVVRWLLDEIRRGIGS